MNQLEKTAELIKISELEKQIEEMKELNSNKGFFLIYFNLLSQGFSKQKSFEKINEKYFIYFNKYKYSDYNSFKVTLTRHYKNNKF
jgi:DNA polymerase III delta subunit